MIEDKARELGRMLGQSNEYKAMKSAREALQGDRDGMTLLQQMEALQQRAQRAIASGEQPTPEMEQELDALVSKMQVHTTYQRLVVSQENFDKLMQKVNQWMVEGIEKGAASPIITLG